MNDTISEARAGFSRRHPTLVILFHWLTVAVIVAGVAFVLTREEIGARDLKRLLLEQHRSLGLLVLVLVGLRLLTRVWHRRQLVTHDLPWVLTLVSGAGHWGLYLLMVSTPLLGWALTSAHGQDATVFGLVTLPPLVVEDTDLADTLADWHLLSAWSLLGLVGIHAVAALWHHFVRRDTVLHAMLPIVAIPSRPVDRSQ
jgi:cytochrome b561